MGIKSGRGRFKRYRKPRGRSLVSAARVKKLSDATFSYVTSSYATSSQTVVFEPASHLSFSSSAPQLTKSSSATSFPRASYNSPPRSSTTPPRTSSSNSPPTASLSSPSPSSPPPSTASTLTSSPTSPPTSFSGPSPLRTEEADVVTMFSQTTIRDDQAQDEIERDDDDEWDAEDAPAIYDTDPNDNSTITRETILSVINELQRRLRPDVTDDEADTLGTVVIASDVTLAQFKRIPHSWLDSLEVELRPDGRLIALGLSSHQQSRAEDEVVRQVNDYAEANNLMETNLSDTALHNRGMSRPTVLLATRPPVGPDVIFALFAVDVRQRSGREIIDVVHEWFVGLPSLEYVVYLKFYRRREGRVVVALNETRVPALGMIFSRVEVTTDVVVEGRVERQTEVRVRLDLARSFGNTALHLAALESFIDDGNQHPLLDNPFPGIPDELLRAPTAFPAFSRSTSRREMEAILRNAQEFAQLRAQSGLVDAPFGFQTILPLPRMDVDLLLVFWHAMRGHFLDFPPHMIEDGDVR